jgi:membrane-associated phospholipid phosphatase
MTRAKVERRRLVPLATLYGWAAALVCLPLVFWWLDPLTDSTRIALHSLPGIDLLMEVARPFGKFETQALMIAPAFLIASFVGWKPAKSWLALTLAAVLISGGATTAIKLATRRERPPVTSDQIQADTVGAAIATGKCMSFPSGDVSSAFAIACVLSAYVPRLRIAAIVIACLVGLSRVYFGCHYFSDVVAGALLGTLTAGLLLVATRRQRGIVLQL